MTNLCNLISCFALLDNYPPRSLTSYKCTNGPSSSSSGPCTCCSFCLEASSLRLFMWICVILQDSASTSLLKESFSDRCLSVLAFIPIHGYLGSIAPLLFIALIRMQSVDRQGYCLFSSLLCPQHPTWLWHLAGDRGVPDSFSTWELLSIPSQLLKGNSPILPPLSCVIIPLCRIIPISRQTC